jgi:hypothetical protein
MNAACVADTGLFVRCGGPENEKYTVGCMSFTMLAAAGVRDSSRSYSRQYISGFAGQ